MNWMFIFFGVWLYFVIGLIFGVIFSFQSFKKGFETKEVKTQEKAVKILYKWIFGWFFIFLGYFLYGLGRIGSRQ